MRRACVGMLLALTTIAVVDAAERPIGASKLLLRRTSSGQEKLVFTSKDPSFLFPTIGGPDDPSPSGSGGMVVELFAPSTPAGVALAAPGGLGVPGWTVRTSPPRLQFKNPAAPAAPSTFRSITLRAGKVVKLSGKASGLALSAPLGSVGIRITTGSLVDCALFGPPTVAKDAAGTFSARNAVASAVGDCSDASLSGTPSTTTSTSTTTTVTSTTAAGVCGDGLVNQPTEQCDGSPGACAPLDCGPPGYSTQCQCCGMFMTYTFPVNFPCCDPTAQEAFFPSTAICVTQDCSGPFQCTFGACHNGTCCADTGAACGVVGGGNSSASVPCCDPSAICGFPNNSFPSAFCCERPGGACSANSDCCTGTCDGGTCSCLPSGQSCLANTDCCSGTCNVTCQP